MRNDFTPEVTLYIVDNDKDVRESMTGLFATACGFRVQAFSSGEEFLARVNLNKPDCVLLDLRMDDGMTGLQVQEAMVAKSSPMVVLFLSGHGDIPTAMDARNNGAYDWLVKGMDTAKLQAKVVAAMKEAQARALHHQQRLAVVARWDELSPRKKEAARLIRQGWSNKLVADEMNIGVRVAEKYRSDVFETLWVNNPTVLDRLFRDYNIE
jgi:FixJ family two-component response regulator